MFKQLWTSIGQLKTAERKLLFGLMLAVIIVFGFALKFVFTDSNSYKTQRIDFLERELIKKDAEKETQRILLQDKIDQCAEERYNALKEIFEKTEKAKQSSQK
jgi:hypothetical protein